MSNYDEVQAAYFEHNMRDVERAIDDNINKIEFDKLSNEEFALVLNSLNVANDILCMIIKNREL